MVEVSWVSRMGLKFDDYPGFQEKITPQTFQPVVYIRSSSICENAGDISRTRISLEFWSFCHIWSQYGSACAKSADLARHFILGISAKCDCFAYYLNGRYVACTKTNRPKNDCLIENQIILRYFSHIVFELRKIIASVNNK